MPSSKDWDQGDNILWCEEHTEMLIQACELGDLWYVYGIIGDIIVYLMADMFYWCIYFHSISWMTFLGLT